MRARTKLCLFPFGFAATLLFGEVMASSAQELDRSKIPDQYKGDLTKLYPSDQAWQSAKNELAAEPKLSQFKGTLGSSAQRLADALEMESKLGKDLRRLSTYAAVISDQDTRVSVYQGISKR
jgi:oligoendopeptidase F